METNAGASRNTVRAKKVTKYPRDLLPTDVCANVSWTSPSVALLMSMDRFGKSLPTYLNFSLDESPVRMIYFNERRCLSQIPFILWWSINVDKALEDVILNRIYYLILDFFKRKMFICSPLFRIRRKVSTSKEEI